MTNGYGKMILGDNTFRISYYTKYDTIAYNINYTPIERITNVHADSKTHETTSSWTCQTLFCHIPSRTSCVIVNKNNNMAPPT